MEKDYYKLLEIDRNASPEIIEKAYKTLAKKYHPDLQDELNKKKSEEIFKQINEAYQTLSDPISKANYDQTLANNDISQDKYDEMYKQNQILKNKLNDLQSKQYSQPTNTEYNEQHYTPDLDTKNENYSRNLEYEQQLNEARQKAYYDAYIQDLKNRGYKIMYKKTFKDYVKNLISLIIVLVILFLLWNLPFVKNYFYSLYNENFAFKYICDIFIKLFK